MKGIDMTTYEGSPQMLRDLRAKLALMRETEANLMKLREAMMACDLRIKADEIHAAEFIVLIPCLLCKTEQRSPVWVWDGNNTVPTGCICQACNDAHLNADGSLV